ncbi:hypothetical protein AJ87_12480 [Rhizobium yanglingense]|nr:hypothetical protein AJ87_12480 [Rhizobium yanglingense]
MLDEQGRSDFGLLQQSLGGREGKRASGEAIFMAFDLLYFDGRDPRQSNFFAAPYAQGLVTDREGEKGQAKLATTFLDPSQ